MNYYISDTHWGQKSFLKETGSLFPDIMSYYQYAREKWLGKIKKTDNVYIVGDILSKNVKNPARYLEGLTGRLHLVVGNNDVRHLENPEFTRYFASIDQVLNIRDEQGRIIVMCHYPMICWEHKNLPNCYHIYGHMHTFGAKEHTHMNEYGIALNAGSMINGYVPCTLEELIANNSSFFTNHLKK
jgi:calcineurin-like phosphoesterase family protein